MKIRINEVDIAYELHGAGHPVLFIHGFPLSRKLWHPLLPPMQDEYRLIVPDLRGFGESGASTAMSMGTFADDLAALLDRIGEQDQVVVVGLSMGGYIAFEFYRRYPERVRALVLADTRPQADDEAGKLKRHATAQRVLAEGSQVVADSMRDALFAPQASDALKEEWWAIMRATRPESIAAALRAMANRPDSCPTLETITVPTLLLVGEEDRITPPDDARAMQAALPWAELEIVPGAGHMTPVEQPQRFAARLLTFLDELDRPDRAG